jgi:glycosyltransferase involved in cell wall biosynthesis
MPTPTLVTIITIVRNDAERLLSTISGVARHKGTRTEYLVVDGNSTDETLPLIQSRQDVIDHFISEPDQGIYDAMNKGTSLAHGKYILFLNAGDELLTDVETLIASQPDSPVLIYGKANMFGPDGTLRYVKGKRLKSIGRFLKGMPLCHQTILYRRDCMIQYDLRFKVMSDRVLTYNLLCSYGLSQTCFADCLMVNYYEGGFCSSFSDEYLREEEDLFYRSVGKSYYILIKRMNALFKHKIKRPFLKAIGKRV